MIESKDVLKTIREKRENLGISQKEIAEHLGISQVSYSKIENGKTTLSFEVFLNIADFLKIDFLSKPQEKSLVAVTETTIAENTVSVATLSNKVENIETLLSKLATKDDIDKLTKLLTALHEKK